MRILFLVLITFCFASCFSTSYIAEKNQGNFDKINAGNKYTFFDNKKKKVAFTVTSEEKDSIKGSRKNLPFAIAKNDINSIRKNNTAGTVLIAGGATTGVTLITVALINVLRDTSEVFTPDQY